MHQWEVFESDLEEHRPAHYRCPLTHGDVGPEQMESTRGEALIGAQSVQMREPCNG